MEAAADTGDWSVVIIDHGEAKGDGEKQAGEVVEVEGRLPSGCRQCGLGAIPRHENGGEHAEEVLAHGVEEAEVLRQKVVDRLIQELEEIGLHGLGSFEVEVGRTTTACGSFEGTRSG